MNTTDISIDKLQDLYLDYKNNFLTLSCFADHYGFSIEQCDILIVAGRKLHNDYCDFIENFLVA